TEDAGLDVARLPEERARQVVDLDEVADLRELLGPHERRILAEELRVVGARAVHVGRREDDDFRDRVALAVLEELHRARDVPAVVLVGRLPWIVHDPHVDKRIHIPGAEDVPRLLVSEVDLHVLDVLGPAGKGTPIDADDAPASVAVEASSEDAAEASGDAGDG